MKSLFKKKNIHLAPQVYTPENTISSYLELPDGTEPLEAIWHTSSIALDTDKICFIYEKFEDGVYFIAAPAEDFLGKDNSASPLAAALPGNEAHLGDGAYICPIGSNLFAVAVKGKNTLSSFVGDKNSVLQFAGDVPNYWVDKGTTRWTSLNQYLQKSTVKLMNILSVSAFSLMMILFITSFGFKYKTETYIAALKEKQNKVLLIQQQTLLATSMRNTNNSLNSFLKKYSDLSAYVINQNGRITSYEYHDNNIKYTVELPETTTNLSFFGPDITPVIKDNVMTIEKEENL